MSEPLPQVEVASDHSLCLRFQAAAHAADEPTGSPSEATSLRLPSPALSQAIRQILLTLRNQPLPGMTDVAAGYESILLRFDPGQFDPTALIPDLQRRLQQPPTGSLPPPAHIELPVWYGDEHGPDLEALAQHARRSVAEVIASHSAALYTVSFLGFSPGFPYLLGLASSLQMPRLASPRLAVPAGSVAIAGAQAGIYPQRSPGGWRLLGRTSVPLMAMDATPWALLLPGDSVRFVPQKDSHFVEPEPSAIVSSAESVRGALHVHSPGPLTTVQDLGRPGYAHLGISAGGAADPLALRLANRLLANPDSAPALEMTVRGPDLRAERDLMVAVAGAIRLSIDGVPVPSGQTLSLRRGQTLRCGAIESGVRAYLAVRGGLAVPRIAGSAATDVRAGFGGLLGRALRAGDVLQQPVDACGPTGLETGPCQLTSLGQMLLAARTTLRVTWGSHADWFPASLRERLPQVPLQVRAQANRTGLRLQTDTPLLSAEAAQRAAQLLTEGVSVGTVQVPPDGQPILLGVEQQVTGGYPKLAQVIAADLPLLGRLRPGDPVVLQPVSWIDARCAYRDLQAQLAAAIQPAPAFVERPVP